MSWSSLWIQEGTVVTINIYLHWVELSEGENKHLLVSTDPSRGAIGFFWQRRNFPILKRIGSLEMNVMFNQESAFWKRQYQKVNLRQIANIPCLRVLVGFIYGLIRPDPIRSDPTRSDTGPKALGRATMRYWRICVVCAWFHFRFWKSLNRLKNVTVLRRIIKLFLRADLLVKPYKPPSYFLEHFTHKSGRVWSTSQVCSLKFGLLS